MHVNFFKSNKSYIFVHITALGMESVFYGFETQKFKQNDK